MIAALIVAAGISLQLPAGWHSMRLPATAPIVDPVVPLVVSSAPIRRNGRQCQVAQFAPPPRAVTIVVLEWRRSYAGTRSGPRPRDFNPRVLPLRPRALECYAGRGGSLAFTQEGRRLGIYVMAGLRAPQKLVKQPRLVLGRLRVARR